MDALAEPHQSSATASLCSSWPKAALTLVVAAQQPWYCYGTEPVP